MRLVPYGPGDLAIALALESDPLVMAELGGPVPAERIRQAHAERLAGIAGGDWYRTVVPDGETAPIGLVGIWRTRWEGATIHEYGIMLRPDRHGRGLGVTVSREMFRRAQGHFEVLHCFCAVSNPAPNAGCRTVGFELAGQADMEYAGRPLRCNHWVLDLSTWDGTGGAARSS